MRPGGELSNAATVQPMPFICVCFLLLQISGLDFSCWVASVAFKWLVARVIMGRKRDQKCVAAITLLRNVANCVHHRCIGGVDCNMKTRRT